MKKLIPLLLLSLPGFVKAQCNASSFSPVTVCPANTTISIGQQIQTDIIYICGQTSVVYDTLTPPSIKYRQVYINNGGTYYFKSNISNNSVTIYAKNGSFCYIKQGSLTGIFAFNQEPTATLNNLSSNTVTINNCTAISSPTTSINCVATGIAGQNREGQLRIFPNPSSDYVVLSSPYVMDGTFTLYNQVGQELFTETGNKATHKIISLSEYPAGVYYLKYSDETGLITRKIIISR